MAIARAPREYQRRLAHDVEICAAADIAELKHVSKAFSRSGQGSSAPYNGYTTNIVRAHRLVRQGFLRREKHSEQIRGERRFYWWAFYITDKGRQIIRAPETPKEPR